MPYVYGKREPKPVKRVLATPSSDRNTETSATANQATDEEIHLYVTFDSVELPPLRYLEIRVHGHTLATLVDSGSNRTLVGREEVKIVRALQLPIKNCDIPIRTANGQIAIIREQITLPLTVQGEVGEITAGLLPNLAVPCILGIDFLTKFGIILDFATVKWDNSGLCYR